MKTLSLQIDQKTFRAILNGEQKEEHRYVYPNNAKRYVIQEQITDEDGEESLIVTPVHYDAIAFKNGRRDNAPNMTVKVEKSEFVILTDDEGNDLTFEENGEEYFVCQVWYYLGEVISTENINK